MRPVRLELKGFTAFRDVQTVDFDGLDLFAIAGPTGSGKSSILDAITYALYGYVERVGKQVGQLVSQGQPRMAVTLEFAVADERYRVTRTTPFKGATKIMLERWEGADWRQAGEGADHVREADAMIREAVGLDYDAFTRSVLLPQGRFAEFLVGDAKDRRAILTELLGLELFTRLRERAGDLARASATSAQANERLLETEYAGVTEEAVAVTEAAAAAAASAERALSEAEANAREIASRWAAAEGELREIKRCAEDARAAAGAARASALALQDLAAQLSEAETAARDMTKASARGAKAAERAASARAKAEGEWGALPELSALRTRAEGLAEREEALGEAEAEHESAAARRPLLEEAIRAAEAELAKQAAAAQRAAAALEAAREAVDRATHADLVAAVRAGMRPGEACPVCGASVKTLPKTSKGAGLDRARTTAAKAQQTAEGADRAAREAERGRDAALSAAQQAVNEIERLDREVARRRKEFTATRGDVAKAFGGTVPPDPVATLEERIDRLEALEDEEEKARDAAQEAERAANLAERTRDALLGSVAEHRARLDALPAAGIVERARAIAGAGFTAPSLPTVAGAKKVAGAVLELAVGLAGGLEETAKGLDAEAAKREEGERRFLSEAEAVVDGLVESPGTLAGLLDAVAEACRTAAAVRATTQKEASGMRERLDNAAKLLEVVAVERGRAATFDALSRELRADRIVAFLQVEALQILAAGGSRHLSTLSGGRYGLAFDEDEFFVIDTWNGDERRRARTLSGGETFLASLGLALALSEQVSSLSVADRARLDSLFLDEGFGTLDPETLEVVVDAIEQLGGDGRIVGVITHVQELAIRLPARIEVEKSPRGSRLQVLR